MVPQTLRFSFDIASPPVYKATHPFAIEHALQIQGAVKEIQEYSEKQYGNTIITLDPIKHIGKQKAIYQSQRFTCNITYPEGCDSGDVTADLCTLGVRHFGRSRFFCDTGSGMSELVYLSEAHAEVLNEIRESLIHGLSGEERTAFISAMSACDHGEASHHLDADIRQDLKPFIKNMTNRAKHKSQAGCCEIREQQEESREEQAAFLEGSQARGQACTAKLDACRARLVQREDMCEVGEAECLSFEVSQEAEQMCRDVQEALSEFKAELASRQERLKRQNQVALAQNATIYKLERQKVMDEHDRKRQKEDLRLLIRRALLYLPFCLCIVYYGANLLIRVGLL